MMKRWNVSGFSFGVRRLDAAFSGVARRAASGESGVKPPHSKLKAMMIPVLFVLVCFSLLPSRASTSLDDVLSNLESNGVITDRSMAVRGGIEGMLKSIDPEAFVGVMDHAGTSVTQAVQSVESWPEDIAYVKVRGLYKGSGVGLLLKLQSLGGKAGVILDLRGANGDDMNAVSLLAGLGRPEREPLFLVLDNRNQPVSTNVVEGRVLIRAPVMVLVDHGTKGAAEALAAVWRGCPGVMLIGSTTHGEARLRDVLELPDGQVATVAARKLMPLRAQSYDGRGVQPDVLVSLTTNASPSSFTNMNHSGRALSAKSERDMDLMKRVDDDVTLRRATDIILGLRTLNGYGQ